jgi:ABC-type transport system involved in multi-copper enzyme maturation permease subunit
MASGKYLAGIILIVTVVWLTMIICLAIVYIILPPLDQLTISRLAVSVAEFMGAGIIILAWLFSWNMLVRFYFRRNLNASRSKIVKDSKRKH